MQVRIYKPTKSAMQSAAGDGRWLLEFVKNNHNKFKEELMGRTSSYDMSNEVKIFFSSMEEAITFANSKQYSYEVITPKKPILPKKSYAANFK